MLSSVRLAFAVRNELNDGAENERLFRLQSAPGRLRDLKRQGRAAARGLDMDRPVYMFVCVAYEGSEGPGEVGRPGSYSVVFLADGGR